MLAGAQRFCAFMSRQLALPVSLTVGRDYDHVLEGILSGGIDFAWMPPLSHNRACAAGATLAALSERRGAVTYRSAILARRDSEFLNVRSLRGVRAAWSGPSSASGYLFARLHLEASGVDLRRDVIGEKFYGSAEAACGAVARGEADLCAYFVSETASRDRQTALDEIASASGVPASQLRVLDFTESIPADGMVLGRRLDLAMQAELRDRLLIMHSDPEGRATLAAFMQADRLAPVTTSMRRLVAWLDKVAIRL